MKDDDIEVMRDGVDQKDVKTSFPSNSHKRKEEKKEETKKLEKIVSGKVTLRKKSLSKRFLETFVGDDVNNIAGYVIHDVLIPAAKDMVYDMIKGSLEMSLFGEKKGSRTRRENGRSYVSYDRFSSDRRDDRGRREVSNQRNRARHNFDDAIFASRGEAEEVLSNLVDLTIDYGQATVADLYQFAGIEDNYTDRKYGWTDLGSASVSRVRDGYVINLPKPVLVD